MKFGSSLLVPISTAAAVAIVFRLLMDGSTALNSVYYYSLALFSVGSFCLGLLVVTMRHRVSILLTSAASFSLGLILLVSWITSLFGHF
jgi:hypothetical protein